MKNEDLVKASHSLIFLRRDLERAHKQARGEKRQRLLELINQTAGIQERLLALLPPSQREPDLI